MRHTLFIESDRPARLVQVDNETEWKELKKELFDKGCDFIEEGMLTKEPLPAGIGLTVQELAALLVK